MYTDFNHFFTVRTSRNLWRIKVRLRLPPHLYFVTALPLFWTTRYSTCGERTRDCLERRKFDRHTAGCVKITNEWKLENSNSSVHSCHSCRQHVPRTGGAQTVWLNERTILASPLTPSHRLGASRFGKRTFGSWSNVAPSTAVCIVIRSCGARNTSFNAWRQSLCGCWTTTSMEQITSVRHRLLVTSHLQEISQDLFIQFMFLEHELTE